MAYIGKAPSDSNDITTLSINPTTYTNPSNGVGSLYLNNITGELMVCTDASHNANAWKNIGNVPAKDEATAAAIALS